MRKSKKWKRAGDLPAAGDQRSRDDPTAVAVTVAWMLTLLCTLAAQVAGVACLAVVRLWPAASDKPHLPGLAAGALLLAALVTGVLCLALTPLVWRLRVRAPGGYAARQVPGRPPRLIVAAAVLVGLAPLVTLVVLWLIA